MKVLLYTHGTRGDLQPYLALAYALNRAGHSATLVGPSRYSDFAESYGVQFTPVTDEGVNLLEHANVRKIFFTTAPTSEESRRTREELLREFMPRMYPKLLEQYWEASRAGADLLVHSHHSRQSMHQIAEKHGIPNVLATLFPHFVASHRYPPELNSLESHPDNMERHIRARDAPFNPMLADMISTWRSEVLELPHRDGFLDHRHRPDGSPVPVMLGFSPHVLEPAADWPDWVHTTGFWSLPAAPGYQPSARLLRFLESGEPPVFFGFSSAVSDDPEKTGRLVLEVVRQTGIRAVVVTAWGGIKVTEDAADVLVESDVPYGWLFNRVRAAVHAGGVGSYNEALKAGIPQVICPFQKEQLMWGRHLHDLGVTTRPLPQSELTADALADAVRQAITSPVIAENAYRLARILSAEDGVENAVHTLERIHREASLEGRRAAHERASATLVRKGNSTC
ncbi:glycosyltransferase [Streptomyces rochei]|uniref:glycosyltransferase n=1 Tax=Streptomyces rochei TaxID=1928 RepID=UPI00373E2603